MNEKFINLTPHTVNVMGLSIEPSGQVARCKEISEVFGYFAGVQMINRTYGEVEDLPEPQSGVVYIVSALVRMALPDRWDLASPGDLIRDENGQITGCENLVIN
jgi:hypothetical protein